MRSLPDDVFDELRSLKQLDLKDNDLIDLPVGVFDRLNALESLNLKGNQLTTLPKGVFDRVLDTLKSDSLSLDDSLKTTYGFSTTTQHAAEGEDCSGNSYPRPLASSSHPCALYHRRHRYSSRL